MLKLLTTETRKSRVNPLVFALLAMKKKKRRRRRKKKKKEEKKKKKEEEEEEEREFWLYLANVSLYKWVKSS